MAAEAKTAWELLGAVGKSVLREATAAAPVTCAVKVLIQCKYSRRWYRLTEGGVEVGVEEAEVLGGLAKP